MDREQLLSDLKSFGPESDEAAAVLAERGDREALPAILASIVRDCGCEVIPDRKISAAIRLADAGAVPLLVAYLERLDEAELEHDAGDIGDEFWRIQTAVRRILVGMGPQVVEPVRVPLAATDNRFTRECLGRVLAEIGQASEAEPGAAPDRGGTVAF
jgi:hypothetical protein